LVWTENRARAGEKKRQKNLKGRLFRFGIGTKRLGRSPQAVSRKCRGRDRNFDILKIGAAVGPSSGKELIERGYPDVSSIKNTEQIDSRQI
jgi:hypothetical protein